MIASLPKITRRRLVLAGIALAATAASARAAPPSQSTAVERFAEVRDTLGAPPRLRLQVAEQAGAGDLRLDPDRLVLPVAALNLARSQEELSGLYVVALGFGRSAQARARPKHASPAEYLVAGAVAALGETLDPIPQRTADREEHRNYDARAPIGGAGEVGAVDAATALDALARAGTCSGPALAYLDRLARQLPSPAAALMAKSTRKALGTLAYPPQETCAAAPAA